MVGNVYEWVGDWADAAGAAGTDWTSQTGLPGGDYVKFGGDGSGFQIPGSPNRGGRWSMSNLAGVFALDNQPANFVLDDQGFRCAR